MPWVRFNTDIFRGETESSVSVFMRGSKRNETFTQAVDSLTLHDSQKLLDLYYKSTRVHECEENKDDKDEHETPKI